MNKKHVLVTSGAGFLGSFVMERLRPKDWCDEVFIRCSREYDLREKEAVIRMYEDARPDIVIHLAAVVGGIQEQVKGLRIEGCRFKVAS